MDNLEIAKALFGTKPTQPNGNQTTTTYGIATSDSVNGSVRVNLGGDTVSMDDDQTIEVETTFAVFEGDEVIVSLVGADGTGKAPVVIGVVGRGDQQQTEIDSVKDVANYFWEDQYGAHVSTIEKSVQGSNILLDSDSLNIRYGNSNSEADQTVYASFGSEVTVGSRAAGNYGTFSQVYGIECVASGISSHSEGYQNTASGGYSHVEGGQSVASGDFSHAEGQECVASGNYSHAEGQSNTASGSNSHAEGSNNTASSYLSHVEGSGNTAAGSGCHIEGLANIVNAPNTGTIYYSHVEGHGNESNALYAHVEGEHSVANANAWGGHVEGRYTIVNSEYQHVQGKYNVEDSLNTYADIIGSGSSSANRKNAYDLDWNGNAEFRGIVYVGGCTPNGETPYPVMRYNSTLSRAEYYNGSAWVEFSGGGGGGAFAYIVTNYPAGSTCTATNGVTTLTAPDTSGVYVFEIPSPATWTVTATDGTNTSSSSVTISNHYQVESVALNYGFYLVKDGLLTDVAITKLKTTNTIVQNTGYVRFSDTSNNTIGIFSSTDAVDLTPFNTLKITLTGSSSKSYKGNTKVPTICIGSSRPTTTGGSGDITNIIASTKLSGTDAIPSGDYTLDVSSYSGLYYIALCMAGTGTWKFIADVVTFGVEV